MLTDGEIKKIVKQKIEEDEKLGYQSGGSGHMGYVSYQLNDIKIMDAAGDTIKVEYNYSTFVESEFTIEPDNPPMEDIKSRIIIIDKNKNIIPGD